MRFDQVPARRDDLDQLVRWQVRKSAPFPIDDACVTLYARVRAAPTAASSSSWSRAATSIAEYEARLRRAGVIRRAGRSRRRSASSTCSSRREPAATATGWSSTCGRTTPRSRSCAASDMIFFRNRAEGRRRDAARTWCTRPRCTTRTGSAGQGFSRVLLGGQRHACLARSTWRGAISKSGSARRWNRSIRRAARRSPIGFRRRRS